MSFAAFAAAYPVEEEPVIDGWLRRGQVGTICGASKARKSWLLNNIIISAIQGHALFNAGTNFQDSAMPRAVATLRRPSERGHINVDVFRANGQTDQFAFPLDYHPKSNETRFRQACRLADLLDRDEDSAKAILQVVETMVEMAGPGPAEPAADRDDKTMVEEAMQNTLSPEAIATIAWGVRRTITNDRRVQRQLDWFATILENMVGGAIDHQKTCDELGLER